MFAPTEKQKIALTLLSNLSITDLMLYGGSRSGKTFILCYAVALRAIKYPNSRHVILRFRFSHVKQAVWYDTFAKVLQLCFGAIKPMIKENKSDWFITFPNGSEVWMGGLDDKDRVEKILGNEYATIYFNECSQISEEAKNTALTRLAQNIPGCRLLALYDCNPPSTRHWTYTTFEKNKVEGFESLIMNPYDNPNLPARYLQILENLPARQRKRFLDGKYIAEVDGALWLQEWIDKARIVECPDSVRIAIGVDPAATTGTHGIVVCASEGDNLYVLNDSSLPGTPQQWAAKVKMLYDKYNADAVVIEINQGGDMAVNTLKQIDKNMNIRKVRASKGKLTRAEPISGIYEQGRAFHVGEFPELEEQMCTYAGEPQEKSPDRMDALVWAASFLMLKNNNDDSIIPDIITTGGSFFK